MKVTISLTVNGAQIQRDVEPRTSLADFLREELRLTATHLGCEHGVCGACTVMVDGAPARACIALAVSLDGAEIRTVEGFAEDAAMGVIKEAFHQEHGLQCGFCTPGMLISARDLIARHPEADDAGIHSFFLEEAARRGAIGALIVHDTDGAGYGWNVVKSPGGENYSLVVPPEKMTSLALQGWISGDTATKLFADAGQDLDVRAPVSGPDQRAGLHAQADRLLLPAGEVRAWVVGRELGVDRAAEAVGPEGRRPRGPGYYVRHVRGRRAAAARRR